MSGGPFARHHSMASPRDLYDTGAPAWRMPSAAGAAAQVLTAGVAGVSLWAAATAGDPHVVTPASTGVSFAPFSGATPGVRGAAAAVTPVVAYSVVATTVNPGPPPRTITETTYSVTGFTLNMADDALNVNILQICYSAAAVGTPIPALAEAIYLNVNVTGSATANDATSCRVQVLSPGPELAGPYNSAFVLTIIDPDVVAAGGLNFVGNPGTIVVPSFSFTVTTVA